MKVKRFLRPFSAFAICLYTISLVVFVNNPAYTYVENSFALFVASIFAFQFLFIEKRFYFPKVFVGFVLFLFFSMYTALFFPFKEVGDLFISLIKIFLFALVLYNLLVYNKVVWALELGIILGLLYSVYIGYFVSRDYFEGHLKFRYAGTLANPNHYAFMLTVSIALLIRRALATSHRLGIIRWLKENVVKLLIYSVIVLFSVEVIFFSVSRQGLLVVLLLLGFLAFQKLISSGIIGKIMTVVLGVSVLYYAFEFLKTLPYVFNRLFSIFSFVNKTSASSIDASLSERSMFAIQAYEYWTNYPIFGLGLNQFKFVNNSAYSHNNFLEILANNGLTGFLFYFSIYFFFLYSALKIRRKNKIDSSWIFVVFLMLCLADLAVVSYMEKPYWLVFVFTLFIINEYNKKMNLVVRLT